LDLRAGPPSIKLSKVHSKRLTYSIKMAILCWLPFGLFGFDKINPFLSSFDDRLESRITKERCGVYKDALTRICGITAIRSNTFIRHFRKKVLLKKTRLNPLKTRWRTKVTCIFRILKIHRKLRKNRTSIIFSLM